MKVSNLWYSHGWWSAAAVIGILYTLTSAWVAPFAIAVLIAIVIESALTFLYLRGRERGAVWATAGTLALTVWLTGGVLLFLERTLYKIPVLGMLVFLLLFAHYTLRSAWLHRDVDIRIVTQESMRLLAYGSICSFGAIFFAALFYFGVGSAYTLLPLLLVPFCISMLHGWFEFPLLRDRVVHSIGAEILVLESLVVLLFLPVAYGFSALVILLTYFLYDEYASQPSQEQGGAHQNDRAISFVIAGIVICLLLVVARWR